MDKKHIELQLLTLLSERVNSRKIGLLVVLFSSIIIASQEYPILKNNNFTATIFFVAIGSSVISLFAMSYYVKREEAMTLEIQTSNFTETT